MNVIRELSGRLYDTPYFAVLCTAFIIAAMLWIVTTVRAAILTFRKHDRGQSVIAAVVLALTLAVVAIAAVIGADVAGVPHILAR